MVVWNRTVAELRVGIEGLSVAARAARIQRRVSSLTDEALEKPITIRPATIGGVSGFMIYAASEPIMSLALGDAAPGQDAAVGAESVASNLQIQDAFNEFGVQIMSPHFVEQPGQPVLVPPAARAPAPAFDSGT